jgi:Arc/MetJ-type ribon-helix-helix transcriptional regulator
MNKTTETSFSLHPSQVKTIRELAPHFGSKGRAIQVAIEILYEKAKNNKLVGSGLAAAAEPGDLKVPMSVSLLPRTERLLDWLADPKRYKSRSAVINSCEAVLSDLYTEYYVHRMTAAEREAETKRARRERRR